MMPIETSLSINDMSIERPFSGNFFVLIFFWSTGFRHGLGFFLRLSHIIQVNIHIVSCCFQSVGLVYVTFCFLLLLSAVNFLCLNSVPRSLLIKLCLSILFHSILFFFPSTMVMLKAYDGHSDVTWPKYPHERHISIPSCHIFWMSLLPIRT